MRSTRKKIGIRPDGTTYALAEPGSQFPIPWAKLDGPIVPLVRALNELPGVQTLECCCGHGKKHLWIILHADCFESLYPLLVAIHANDERRQQWIVRVELLPKRGLIQCRLLTTLVGAAAYEDADRIACFITHNTRATVIYRVERREVE